MELTVIWSILVTFTLYGGVTCLQNEVHSKHGLGAELQQVGSPMFSEHISAMRRLAAQNCPCTDPSLCDTIKTTRTKEIFLFSVSSHNWQDYDWDHITTITMFGYYDPKLMCFAHSKGVRVVDLGGFGADLLTNDTARIEWVMSKVEFAVINHLDGINLDIEFALTKEEAPLLTSFVQMTTEVFKQSIPHSQVTFDVAWSPDCIDLRCYDHKAIADTVDFVFVMSYDEQSQIFGDCIAKANSPYDQTAQGVEAFLKLGIPAKKLVLGVPWYGYNYKCLTVSETDVCTIPEVPFRGVNCSDAAGNQKSFVNVMKLLVLNSTTGRKWNATYKAPYFDYKNSETGEAYQVWYDDTQSLQLRYDYAKKMGLYGVGPWNADLLDYGNDPIGRNQTDAMWSAMATFLNP
ncbi:di-N-acetylchitobiase [Strongylocentrotus purpuratus]|uniref:Di-N-acetylchitobiase n=1 Tax=Strongylocentrotus purpuratus TaxID=7668 RepID=A0A7M7T3D5_STRPU|nr:di-N-acetylchitobiase [Strongylocentrotus purpuratus]